MMNEKNWCWDATTNNNRTSCRSEPRAIWNEAMVQRKFLFFFKGLELAEGGSRHEVVFLDNNHHLLEYSHHLRAFTQGCQKMARLFYSYYFRDMLIFKYWSTMVANGKGKNSAYQWSRRETTTTINSLSRTSWRKYCDDEKDLHFIIAATTTIDTASCETNTKNNQKPYSSWWKCKL